MIHTYPSTFDAAQAAFLAAYPSYATTAALDDLREREYARLDAAGQVYLDYTGGGLYAESQLRGHLDLLSGGVFGNPHSHNPTSQAMTGLVDEARAYVLEYFNASPGEYVVIFTPNASGALKLVGEAYPFGPGDHYLLTFDNHNSVNGIREFAAAQGRGVHLLPVVPPELRVDPATLAARAGPGAARPPQPVRLPGPVQLLRRAAPAGVDQPGAGQGLGRAAGCGGLRADQPARPGALAARFRAAVVLQDVRLSHRRRLPAGAAGGAGEAAAALVRGRHDHHRVGAGGRLLPGAGRGRLRGRHGQLPEHPRRRDRAAPPGRGGHRRDPRAGDVPDRLADRAA